MGGGPILLTQVECDNDYDHILHCPVVAFSHFIHTCSHFDDVAVQCVPTPSSEYEGGVRLVGGPQTSEGILEVYVFSQWFAPCVLAFREGGAKAVCNQLGYTNGVGSYIVLQKTTSPSWVMGDHDILCNPVSPCFSRCYTRPSSVQDIVQTCNFSTHVYIKCDFVPSLLSNHSLTTFGNSLQCDLGPPPAETAEPASEDSSGISTGGIVGIVIGVVVFCLVVSGIIFGRAKHK